MEKLDPLRCDERQIIKEKFRRLHAPAKSRNEDVMSRFYGIEHNNDKPVLIGKAMLDRLLKKYGACGMMSISAYRKELGQEANDANARNLIGDIKHSGFSYLPVYCSSSDTEDNYEPSFIVFNYGADGRPGDLDKLKCYGMKWCGDYDLDGFIVMAPNEPPTRIDRNGCLVDYSDDEETTGCYVNPMPMHLSERMQRRGEIMIWE